MKTHNVICRDGKKGLNQRELTLPIELPDTLEMALEHWGEAVAIDMMNRGAKIQAQSVARGKMRLVDDQHLNDAAILKSMEGWKPKVGRDRASSKDKAMKQMASLLENGSITPDELRAILLDAS